MKWQRIGTRVASGGNGDVYRVVSESGEPPGEFAQKVLRPDRFPRYDRFKREAERTLKTVGPGILTAVEAHLPEAITEDDPPYIVTPWMPDGSLWDWAKSRDENMAWQDRIRPLRKVFEAVAWLHEQGIAHRDIKPPNILLDRSDGFLTDFGLSLAFEDARLTETLERVGSSGYVAPELYDGRADELDHRAADVFSLGKTIWATACAKRPPDGPIYGYRSTNLATIIEQGCLALQDLVRRMTSESPASRPPIAAARQDFESLLLSDSPRQGSAKASGQTLAARLRLLARSEPDMAERVLEHETARESAAQAAQLIHASVGRITSSDDYKELASALQEEKLGRLMCGRMSPHDVVVNFRSHVTRDGREPRWLEALFIRIDPKPEYLDRIECSEAWVGLMEHDRLYGFSFTWTYDGKRRTTIEEMVFPSTVQSAHNVIGLAERALRQLLDATQSSLDGHG